MTPLFCPRAPRSRPWSPPAGRKLESHRRTVPCVSPTGLVCNVPQVNLFIPREYFEPGMSADNPKVSAPLRWHPTCSLRRSAERTFQALRVENDDSPGFWWSLHSPTSSSCPFRQSHYQHERAARPGPRRPQDRALQLRARRRTTRRPGPGRRAASAGAPRFHAPHLTRRVLSRRDPSHIFGTNFFRRDSLICEFTTESVFTNEGHRDMLARTYIHTASFETTHCIIVIRWLIISTNIYCSETQEGGGGGTAITLSIFYRSWAPTLPYSFHIE